MEKILELTETFCQQLLFTENVFPLCTEAHKVHTFPVKTKCLQKILSVGINLSGSSQFLHEFLLILPVLNFSAGF